MKKLLVGVALCAAIAAGCAERAHRHHRHAAPCAGEDQGWVNPYATPKISEFGLNEMDSSGAVHATGGAYRISADSLTATSYRHQDGRVESTGCAACHATAGKHCSGCNKVPPSVEYCTSCHH